MSRTRGIAVIRSRARRRDPELHSSKFIRRVEKKLTRRVNGYNDVPAAIKPGFHKPGSQNRNKH